MRRPGLLLFVCCVLWLFIAASPVHAEITLPPIISSHMVLQRGVAAPIWGTASPGERVSVKFRGQEKSAVTDAQGRWGVKLDALAPAEPGVMTIAGANTITLEDVAVGEVWVGSGQSNMEYNTSMFTNDPVLVKWVAQPHPQVRLATASIAWQQASPETAKRFSALLFSFAVSLQQELNVPVGVVCGAVGGKPSGYFVTREMLQDDEAVRSAIAEYDAARVTPYLKKGEEDLAKYTAEKARWDALPETGRPPAPAKPVPLKRGGETYGESAGYLYDIHIKPIQPFAIRGVLWDQGESGTALEGVNQLVTMGALIRGWRKAWGQGEFPFIYVQKPSGGGYAWPVPPQEAVVLLKPDPDAPPTQLPHLPAKMGPPEVPQDGEVGEMFARIMQYPRTGMVIGTDLGGGLHPQRKSAYGERAARVARALAYEEKIECYGPIFSGFEIEGDAVRIRFTHVGGGLTCPEGQPLQGFAVAGKDKVFYWGKAVIEGDCVVVKCDQVSVPAAVRYAWSSLHPWANLFNKERLPAVSFRTDTW